MRGQAKGALSVRSEVTKGSTLVLGARKQAKGTSSVRNEVAQGIAGSVGLCMPNGPWGPRCAEVVLLSLKWSFYLWLLTLILSYCVDSDDLL